MHQNKPTAPITYITEYGKRVTLPEDESQWPKEIRFLNLTLPEIALIQTLVCRSLLNCNCNLNKGVLKGIVDKIKDALPLYIETTGHEAAKIARELGVDSIDHEKVEELSKQLSCLLQNEPGKEIAISLCFVLARIASKCFHLDSLDSMNFFINHMSYLIGAFLRAMQEEKQEND